MKLKTPNYLSILTAVRAPVLTSVLAAVLTVVLLGGVLGSLLNSGLLTGGSRGVGGRTRPGASTPIATINIVNLNTTKI